MYVEKLYQEKRRSAEEIAAMVEPGWGCCTDIAASYPTDLMEVIAGRDGLDQVTVHTMLDVSPNLIQQCRSSGIRPVSWFSGGGLRRAVQAGRADVMPCYYRDMPSIFRQYVHSDAVFLMVAPMDRHGYFSAGVTGSNIDALLDSTERVFLQVNDQMPRALAAPQIHVSRVTALWKHSVPLPVLPPAQVDEISRTIGNYIAQEVPNGATIQLGIGGVPEAVGLALKDKHDLGIHTELFTDSMVELLECGAVTNRNKPIYRGQTVAAFAFGSQRIYDFVDDNPAFVLLGVDRVNDPAVIASHPNFISVNSAVEVDLFGQVCAESAGVRHLSGTGGQADFVRGATQSEGGKSFIAFPSTAMDGAVSRICSELSAGAVVTTSKNDVDYVVTEYGVAKLRGKTLSQRARALIGIAHPKFREELTAQAKARNILI